MNTEFFESKSKTDLFESWIMGEAVFAIFSKEQVHVPG